MAKKTKKRPLAARYASQVGAESTLKFGPEQSSLAAALKDADKQYSGDVAVAHGTARAIEQAAKTAKPKLTSDYKVERGTVDRVKSTLAQDLAKLPAAGALAGASARDAAGTNRRLAESLAAAKAETDSRAQDATAGESYAIANARSRRADTRAKVTDRSAELAREQGAFAQGRTGELVDAARQRSLTRRGQDKTSATARANRKSADTRAQNALDEATRHHKVAEKNAVVKRKQAGRVKPEQTQKLKSSIARAILQTRKLKAEVSNKDKAAGVTQRDRAATAQILLNGRPGQKIENDPKTGKALSNPINVPGVKSTDEYVASIALDIAYDGHISTRNMEILQKMGYSVRELGLNTAGRSGTRGAKKPQPMVPAPARPAAGKTNPLTGTTLGGLPVRP